MSGNTARICAMVAGKSYCSVSVAYSLTEACDIDCFAVDTLQRCFDVLQRTEKVDVVLLSSEFATAGSLSKLEVLDTRASFGLIIFGQSLSEEELLALLELGADEVVSLDGVEEDNLRLLRSSIARAARRREADRKLRNAIAVGQQRLKSVAESIPNLLWISDTEGNRVFFNESWLRFTGSTIEEEINCGWCRHIPSDSLVSYLQYNIVSVESRAPWHIQLQLADRQGNYVSFLESAQPRFSEDGTFVGYVGYCTALAETHSGIENTLASGTNPSKHPSNTVEQAPIGIVRVDNDYVICSANRYFAKMLGLSKEEVVGEKILEVLEGINADVFRQAASTKDFQLISHTLVLKSHNPPRMAKFDIAIWQMLSKGGDPEGMGLSLVEVTERQNAMQEKEDFIAAIVHDLKTPLVGADLTLDAMLGGALGPVDDKLREVLCILKRSNKSLCSLVQSMIEVYRCQNQLIDLSMQRMSVFDVAIECINEVKSLYYAKGVSLGCNLFAKGGGEVLGDRSTLRRVIQNLLDNALKFTSEAGKVKVVLEDDGEWVTVSVKDNGVGISQGDQEHVFERCWQGQPGKVFEGTSGLGLYLCQEIARRHGGEVLLDSEVGRGSTFTLRVPSAFPKSQSESSRSSSLCMRVV